MKPADLKRLALLMAVSCVRNTIIEDYHAQGKLNDAEMMAFNKEVANKIYTFLTFLFARPVEDQQAFLSAVGWSYPKNWDQPTIDRSFADVVKMIKKKGDPLRQNRSDEP